MCASAGAVERSSSRTTKAGESGKCSLKRHPKIEARVITISSKLVARLCVALERNGKGDYEDLVRLHVELSRKLVGCFHHFVPLYSPIYERLNMTIRDELKVVTLEDDEDFVRLLRAMKIKAPPRIVAWAPVIIGNMDLDPAQLDRLHEVQGKLAAGIKTKRGEGKQGENDAIVTSGVIRAKAAVIACVNAMRFAGIEAEDYLQKMLEGGSRVSCGEFAAKALLNRGLLLGSESSKDILIKFAMKIPDNATPEVLHAVASSLKIWGNNELADSTGSVAIQREMDRYRSHTASVVKAQTISITDVDPKLGVHNCEVGLDEISLAHAHKKSE